MIRAWENGRYAPSERYEFLYRAVFPDLAVMMNGAGPMYGPDPDPAVVLERARHAPPDPAGLELAASASPEITALAARVAELRRQVEENTARLRQLLSEAGGEDCDDR